MTTDRAARSTTDMVVLAFAFTVCLVLLLSGAAVLILEVRDPATDTERVVDVLDGIVQVLIGAVLGYLAHGSHRADDGPGGQVEPPSAHDERTEP